MSTVRMKTLQSLAVSTINSVASMYALAAAPLRASQYTRLTPDHLAVKGAKRNR
jgi:hypothetical protein